MKNRTHYLILFLFIIVLGKIFAQNNGEVPTAYINLAAKYTAEKSSIELRFFANQKSVLYEGIKNGFIIERAEITSKISKEEDIKYQKIKEVFPFTNQEWAEALQTSDLELKKHLEVAKSFFDNKGKSKTSPSNEGFLNIIEQKKTEDFEFAMLVLSAIQKEKIAYALGLGFLDVGVNKNTKYVYRATVIDYNGPYKIVEVPYLITTNKKLDSNKRKIDITEGDTKLGFTWEENDMVSGVLVERKNKETGVYESLNENPKYSLSENSLRNGFEDTNLKNYETYEYRFYGFNAFGEKILFGEEKAMPRDLTPPRSPLMQSAEHTKPNEVIIKWNVPNSPDGDLKGFKVKRGTTVDGEFKALHEKLLGKSIRSYSDKNFNKEGSNYYVVQAIDTAGNTSVSYSAYATLIDTIAPNKPIISKGTIDSLGVVTLNLKANTEKDLMGYRLFVANNPEHEFSAIKEDFDNDTDNPKPPKHSFNDTISLKSLTPYVYYRVKALDYHYNQSDFSEIYKIKRIDTIAPTTPVFKNVIVGEDTISLDFALSQSKDVEEHLLYRKTNLKSSWKEIAKIKNTQTSYTDKGLEKGLKYYYSLRAKDNSNLFSEYATPVAGKPYDNGKREAIIDFKRIKNNTKHTLSWKYPSITEDTYFIIYRTNLKGDLVQYKRTNALSFSEKPNNNKYSYAVRAFTKDGGGSPLSKIIQ